ncbi:MAG: VWA domain-containing protein [Clostridia bacterium]|nr:VWA domain-containing protein [Clostridia bacterium]
MIRKKLLPIFLITLSLLTIKSNSRDIEIMNNTLTEQDPMYRVYLERSLGAESGESPINIDYLVIGDLVEHRHIYERKYDNTYHWEQCYCGNIINKVKHTIARRGGIDGEGTNTCSARKYPPVQEYCTDGCGYYKNIAYLKHTPKYTPQSAYRQHIVTCRVEGYHYTNKETYEGKTYTSDLCFTYKNGKKVYIGCGADGKSTGLGTCAECGLVYTESMLNGHSYGHPNGKIGYTYCHACDTLLAYVIGTPTIQKVNYNTLRVTTRVKAASGVTLLPEDNFRYTTWSGIAISPTCTNKSIVRNPDGSITLIGDVTVDPRNPVNNYSLILQIHYRDTKSKSNKWLTIYPKSVTKGEISGISTGASILAPDYYAPTINSISVSGNGTAGKMSNKAIININCTEAWDSSANYVYVRLLDSNKKAYTGWKLMVKNGTNFSTQYDFVGEVKAPQTFYVEVKDSCENVSQRAVTIQYVDSRPPKLLSGTKVVYNSEWSQTKDITIIATDYGVEGVQMAFNEYTDAKLKLSTRISANTWKQVYTVTGDIYEDVKARVYARDAAGNRDTVATVTIGKLDITPPTVERIVRTKIDENYNQITIYANDYSQKRKKEGSGVYKYAIAYNTTMPTEESAWQTSKTFKIKANTKYWVWVKDLAGNITFYIPEEIYLEKEYKEIDKDQVDSRGLVSETGKGWNYVILKWNIFNNDVWVPTDGYTFRLMQKSDEIAEWRQVSTNYNKQVKVLNIYPVGLTGSYVETNTEITFKSEVDGKTYTLPKSASLKKWMEEANSEQPKGYGQGLISVDVVSIDEYNNDPDKYLKDSNGKYQYDVIMFGTWDCNGKRDLNQKSVDATRAFINTGRGVLYGHDVITNHDDNSKGDLSCNHIYFNQLQDTANTKVQNKTGEMAWIGSRTVRVVKKGYLTKYPYDIEERNLTIPYSHTTGEFAYGDIWLRYVPPFGAAGPEQGENANNNYFITAWNNCAVTRTGHSNCAATPDEQKILANVLWYLGQVTEDTEVHVRTAEDLKGPDKPLVSISADENQTKFNIGVRVEDRGSLYEFQIKGTTSYHVKYSNTVTQEVKVGVKGFSWIITDNQTLTTEQQERLKEIKDLPEEIDYKTNANKWLHIRGIDWEGNLGEIATVQIVEGELIPREELKEKLFCIEYGTLIPAIDDGTEVDATVKLESRDGTYRDYLTVKTPSLNDIIGRRFVSPVITADGKVDQRYRDAISYSIGRYIVNIEETMKNGIATNKEAYILQYWEENTDSESYVQSALYSTEIALKNNSNYNWPQSDKTRALVAEAENYDAYRRAWYEPRKISHEEKIYISEDYNSYFVGPFELDYLPEAVQITIGQEKREPVYFFKIIGARIYDTNGKVIGQKDENGNNTGLLNWEFEYITKGDKRESELFSYENYKFPVNEEEFYIKINNLPKDVIGISKIEYEYEKLTATAKYELLQGTYNKVKWSANEISDRQSEKAALWCEGGNKCTHEPHHDRATLIGGYVYLKSTKFAQAGVNSQKLLRLLENKKVYEQYIQTIYPNKNQGENSKWKLTEDINGSIWNDGIEDKNNGLKDENEKVVDNVKITTYRVDKNGNRIGEKYETRTNSGGIYSYKDMLAGLYDVEFEYDGQTYKTTKLLVSGSVEDYKKYYSGTKYIYDSIANETRDERQELNNRYEEIYADSKSRDGSGNVTHDLQYRDNGNGTSTIITSDDNIVKDQYTLQARTSTNGIYYPIVEKKKIGNTTAIEVVDIYNANLGLAERIKTDENLGLDVYKTIFGIKGLKQEYIYSGKDLRNKDSNKNVEKYNQKLSQADYEWRWGTELEEVWDSGEECELKSYIDYMIVIRNSGEKDFVRISELADYYSNNLSYSNSGYRDVPISSYAYLKWDKIEESKSQVIEKINKITWNTKSKYGYKNPNMEDYNDLYTTDLETFELQKGQFIEVHIIFEVNQKLGEDLNGLDIEKEFENFSEIMGYKTYYIADRSVAGLIDIDSRPGNMIPSLINKEDDEDKAPNIIYELEEIDEYNPNGSSENDGNGTDSGNDGNNGTGNGDNSKKSKNYGNVLEGNVWEDLRFGANTKVKSNNQRVADGLMQAEEPKVNYVKVELVEMFTKKDGGQLEIIRQTARTNSIYSINKAKIEDGGYCFANLSAGKYKIKFTFGDYEQIEKEIKYNGQDFQAKYTPDLYGSEFADDFSNVEIMLTIDVSRSMTGRPLEQEKEALTKLINELTDKLPGINIGLVKFSTSSAVVVPSTNKKENIINNINNLDIEANTNITSGIRTSLEQYLKDDKIKNRVMVLITDGQETVTSTETVRRAIETVVDKEDIKLVTLLTMESEDIFGTEEYPTRGKIYLVNEENNLENAINDIKEEILEESIVENDRSLTHEIEGNKENPEKGTRWYDLLRYETIDSKKGELLAIENISNMPEQTDEEKELKTNKMKTFADETHMRAESDISIFKPNSVGRTRLHQMNMALEERPKVELTLEAEIENLRITLSDGTILIDAQKGLTKNVSGLGKGTDVPINVFMDEEIMQGAEVRVDYKVKITNTGEIDTLANYIKGESTATIPTIAKVAYNYTKRNMLYREDDGSDPMWKEINLIDALNSVNSEVGSQIRREEEIIKIYSTEELSKPLYPKDSIEATKDTTSTNIIAKAVMSKLLSPESDEDILNYNSAIEIVERQNDAGRRSYKSVPGNYFKGTDNIEPDTAITQSLLITKPFGENRNIEYILYIVAGLSIVAVTTGTLKLRNKRK